LTEPRAAAPEPPPLGWRGVGTHYAGFAAGVALATWPLALHPATTWPTHHDPRLFTWVMASMARRLLTDPLHLFHGNALYPFGESLAFSEVLMAPSLLGLPGFVWGNPILTYNLLLLLLWPANGAAMAWVAYRLTGSRPAAWLAGAVFCLSPYFTEYHVEFQMLLAAPIPLVLFAWVRWLEGGERCWLVLVCAGLTVQGLTTWYYTIILGLGLVTIGLAVLALRWSGWHWRRRLVELGAGALLVAAVLLPVALPYLAIHAELGFERGLDETAAHYADLFTFVEPGWRSLLYDLAPGGHLAETSTFVGFGVLALAAASVVWLRRDPPLPVAAAGPARAARLALGAMSATALLLLLAPLPRARAGPVTIHLKPAEFLDLAVLFGFAVLLVRGWAAWREGRPRRLAEGDWVRVLLVLAAVFTILALGPVIHVRREAVATGPYLSLYHVLLPLHVVRITARFAVLTIAALALLAALGLAALERRLRPRWARHAALATVFAVVALEYAVGPPAYQRVAWAARPVDAALRADPADVAVLEWPTHAASADTDAMFRSLVHGKRVVNGHSGFVPELIRELSGALTTPGPPFPAPEAAAALRRIYPLRYLVVRLADPDLPRNWVGPWLAVGRAPPPWLRHVATYGTDDLYEIVALPEPADRIERWVSYDFLRGHHRLALRLRPLAPDPGREAWVDVALNERPVQRVRLTEPVAPVVLLPGPYRLAAPNVITLEYGYRRPPATLDGRYRIGRTGARGPGDIRVVSVGETHGSASSIRFNGRELSPDRRGYNLVALDAAGQVLGARSFDTFLDEAAAHELAAWVRALPIGAVVAGAVRDEASLHLTDDALVALKSLGVAGDLRGHFREAHAFVGVKGAAPATAVEALGNRPLEVTIGRPGSPFGFELAGFALEAPEARR